MGFHLVRKEKDNPEKGMMINMINTSKTTREALEALFMLALIGGLIVATLGFTSWFFTKTHAQGQTQPKLGVVTSEVVSSNGWVTLTEDSIEDLVKERNALKVEVKHLNQIVVIQDKLITKQENLIEDLREGIELFKSILDYVMTPSPSDNVMHNDKEHGII